MFFIYLTSLFKRATSKITVNLWREWLLGANFRTQSSTLQTIGCDFSHPKLNRQIFGCDFSHPMFFPRLFNYVLCKVGCDFGCENSHLNVAPESHDFWVRLFAPKTFRCELSGAKKSHPKVSLGAKIDFQVRKKSHLLLFFVLVNWK